MSAEVLRVTRVIAASPESLFAVVADPARHADIDGSGTLKGGGDLAGTRLALGAKFSMSMHMGVGYKMINEVVEFEDGRVIAWEPHLDGPGLISRITGAVTWRYTFEAVDGGTLVTETWDPKGSNMTWLYRLVGQIEKSRAAMEKTLERLEQLTTPTSGD